MKERVGRRSHSRPSRAEGPGKTQRVLMCWWGLRRRGSSHGITVAVALVTLGLALLIVGARWLVDGAAGLARRVGITPFVIAATVVGFGTSAPELAVSVSASAGGQPDLAVGNALGSNVFNLAVILGVAALVRPLRVSRAMLGREGLFLLASFLIFAALSADGVVDAADGVLMLVFMTGFTWISVQSGRRDNLSGRDGFASVARADVGGPKPRRIAFGVLAGLALLIGGSQALVAGAVDLAVGLGISARVIALTIVAAGTSLPELATSVAAAARRQEDIAVGNIVGSNVFNLLAILGVSAIVAPLPLSPSGSSDLAVMAIVTLAFLGLAWNRLTLSRAEGAVLLAGYVTYVVWLLL